MNKIDKSFGEFTEDNYSISAAGITKMKIFTDTSSIQVDTYSGNEIIIEVNKKQISVKENSNELLIKIQDMERFKRSIISSENVVKVKLPHKIFNIIEVNTENGNITVGEIVSGQIILGTETGDVILNNTRGSIRAKLETGETKINMQYIENDINVTSETGDITVSVENEPSLLKTKLISGHGITRMNLPIEKKVETLDETIPYIYLASEAGDVKLLKK